MDQLGGYKHALYPLLSRVTPIPPPPALYAAPAPLSNPLLVPLVS